MATSENTVYMENDLNVDLCDVPAMLILLQTVVLVGGEHGWVAGKITIAPKNWFGPKGPQDWNDVYCDGWEVL